MSSAAPDSAFVSIFQREFDVAICGAGFVGLSAAEALAKRGLSTLLFDASGDLLWEATRALENSAEPPVQPCEEWTAWLETLRAESGADDLFLEPALAEILAAHEFSAGGDAKPAVLLYAPPLALERSGSAVSAAIVATKSGPRRVRARRWLDATENGDLARLFAPALEPRTPTTCERSFLLHTREPGALDSALDQLCSQDAATRWSPSLRPEERRVRLVASCLDNCAAWHRRVPELVAELRVLGGSDAPFVLSLCGTRDFPRYDERPAPATHELPANLLIGSPALRGEKLQSLADRFALGVRLARTCAELPPVAPATALAAVELPSAALSREATDVLVAGVGTGGAIAAIAAARAGARVRAIDFTSWPGGVGTGAGICGYFHGAKGGLQTEVDERTRCLTKLFTGASAQAHVWHHEAKKIALLALFDEAGVDFIGEAFLAGVERDAEGRIGAALAVVSGTLVRLPATAFIDGTGDGDLAAFAGATFASGRPGDGRTLSYSQSIFHLGTKEGIPLVRSCNFDAGWLNPTDAEDLTRARLIGIAQHLRTPWTHSNRAIAVAPWIGLRQSRHIETDYVVGMSDLIDGARFDDAIGETETVADTHSVDFEFESDELAFYYWTCRGFRNPLRCELPYRMLLPRGLENLWVACRAAGISVDAAYGLRMQRDMQRLGEAAGLAAAQAAARRVGSRAIDLAVLQTALTASGAKPGQALAQSSLDADALLVALDRGLPGMHLWRLFRDPARYRALVHERLASPSSRTSFYSAALLAMWNDTAAEPRLLVALHEREDGPAPEDKPVLGAFGQCIDLPFWLQAVLLLRRVGTARCLPTLRALAETPRLPLNVRTILALTLERLAERIGDHRDLCAALEALAKDAPPDPVLPPSRSLWRTLHGEPQKKLPNDHGAPVAQDHSWQLHLAIARAQRRLGLPTTATAQAFAQDPRAFVRAAFQPILKSS